MLIVMQMDKTPYNFMDQQGFVLTQLNPTSDPPAHVASMNVASTAGPQPIPLPNQAIHGQSLTEQGFSASQQQAPVITEAMVRHCMYNKIRKVALRLYVCF